MRRGDGEFFDTLISGQTTPAKATAALMLTVAELTQDFRNAIDFYLKECEEAGRAPTKPASGKLMLRIPPEVHGAALVAAQAAGTSLNQWAARVLAQAARQV